MVFARGQEHDAFRDAQPVRWEWPEVRSSTTTWAGWAGCSSRSRWSSRGAAVWIRSRSLSWVAAAVGLVSNVVHAAHHVRDEQDRRAAQARCSHRSLAEPRRRRLDGVRWILPPRCGRLYRRHCAAAVDLGCVRRTRPAQRRLHQLRCCWDEQGLAENTRLSQCARGRAHRAAHCRCRRVVLSTDGHLVLAGGRGLADRHLDAA